MVRPINENSLKNLRLPKKKKEGYGYNYAIPQEKVDELFSFLAEGMSLRAAAKEAGICAPTARRYFREGDAKRGIKPLVQRLTIFQERISDKMNVLMEEQRMERLAFIRDLITKTQSGILQPQKFFDVDGNEITVYDNQGLPIQTPDLNHVSIRDIERLVKLEVFLCGGVKSQERENTMLTADQISGQSNNEDGS